LETLSPDPTAEYVIKVLTGFIVAAVIFDVAANVFLVLFRRIRHVPSSVDLGPVSLSADDRAWITSQVAQVEQQTKDQIAAANLSIDEKIRNLQAQIPKTVGEEEVPNRSPEGPVCPKCGQELLPDARFCGECGSPLDS
jgi:hypothetical protein